MQCNLPQQASRILYDSSCMPSRLQEVVVDLCETYGLDLSQTHTSLHLYSHYPGFLLIAPLGAEELLVAYAHKGKSNTTLMAPGIIFGIASSEWYVLEIAQDNTRLAPIREVPLETDAEVAQFCDRFAQVILQHWAEGLVLFKLMREENTSPPPSDPELLDL
jgi:hypothetical protein